MLTVPAHPNKPDHIHGSPFLQALRKESVKRPPFWFMRQAGRYLPEYREIRSRHEDFLSMCYTPRAAVEVTLQPVTRFDTDAAILFCDILVVPDALGAQVEFISGRGPVLSPIRDADALKLLSLASLKNHLAPVYEAVASIRATLPSEKSLIGFAGAPWTVACYMVEGEGSRDFAQTRLAAYRDPEFFTQLMALLTQATTEHLLHQVAAGADAVQLFDSWAGVLPEDEYVRWVIAPTAEIVRTLKQHYPELPVIGFPKSSGMLYARYVQETGVDGVGVDAQLPLEFARDRLQPHAVVQGNLDPLLLAADKDKAIAQMQCIFSCWKDQPFIFNLGHGMIPATPPAHVEALARAVRELRF